MKSPKYQYLKELAICILAIHRTLEPQTAMAQMTAPITLSSFIEAVAKTHPDAVIEERNLARAKEIERRSGLLPDPQLAIGRNDVPLSQSMQTEPIEEMAKESAQWQISLSQSFPWPGTLGAESKAAQASTDVTKLNAEITRLQRIFGAKELFLRLVQLSKTIEIQKANLKVVESIRDFSHDRFKQGIGSHLEFLQTHSESAVLRRNLANLEADLRNIKREILVQMTKQNQDDVDSLVFDLNWPDNAGSSLTSKDIVQKSLLRAKEGELARNERDYRRTLPSFMATGMFMQQDSGMRMYGAMVGITVPIYSNIQRSSLSNEGSLLEDNAEQKQAWHLKRKQLASTQVKEKIQQIEENLKALREEIIPSIKSHAQAATVEYSQGNTSINSVIDARRNLLNLEMAEVQTLEALHRANIAAQKIDVGLIDEVDFVVPQLPMPGANTMSMGNEMSKMSERKGMRRQAPTQKNTDSPPSADSSPREETEKTPSGGMQGM
ncbi:MAG: TolC family protein [Oligoflexales bacterium]